MRVGKPKYLTIGSLSFGPLGPSVLQHFGAEDPALPRGGCRALRGSRPLVFGCLAWGIVPRVSIVVPFWGYLIGS